MPTFKKQIILKYENGYTVKSLNINQQPVLAVGPEKQGDNFILEAPQFNPTSICDGPGGTMSILNIPNTDVLVSIMGLFPPFIGKDGGVFLHTRNSSNDTSWTTRQILPLPFAHRMEFLSCEEKLYLIVASVSKDKKTPQDWSKSGEIYGCEVPKNLSDPWDFKLIFEGVTRNHGMQSIRMDGKDCVLISGAEGVFSIYSSNSEWQIKKLLSSEVSEVFYSDLNNDGQFTLVTIEPFHGNKLCVYQKQHKAWQKTMESNLAFGHGLWAGNFKGIPSIFVGNRAEGKELLHFQVDSETCHLKKSIIDKLAGPTQIDLFEYNNESYIVSSNQALGEIALYTT